MPKVTAQASLVSSALNPTPAAMPSGSLCRAIAITNSSMRSIEALLRCSSWSRPVILCMCGVTQSSTFRNRTPATTPITGSHQPPPACSRAGTIKPSEAAASMMPAQKPSTASFHLCGNSLMPNPISAPITVAMLSPAALNHTCDIDYTPNLYFSSWAVWFFVSTLPMASTITPCSSMTYVVRSVPSVSRPYIFFMPQAS